MEQCRDLARRAKRLRSVAGETARSFDQGEAVPGTGRPGFGVSWRALLDRRSCRRMIKARPDLDYCREEGLAGQATSHRDSSG